ncbi:MAG TPA: bifunctional riboflavin kinase/FAD synthetase [Ignavibacteria bacterium]|nr:bifunctional riboflavin kinase/FAD synthetase [Ignavibacteria bacterium]
MNVYYSPDSILKNTNTVVTIGTFDGVHMAHRKVINHVLELAKQKNLRSFIVTFEPHPQEVLRSKSPDIKLLSSIDERLQLFEQTGIGNVLVIKFTEDFSHNEPREFYSKYISGKIGLCDLVIGYDHLFGRNRGGDFNTLIELGKEFGFRVHRVEEIDVDGMPVSSTRIRAALAEGKIEDASSLLGYDYSFEGIIVEGDKVGRSIGYPTVNLKPVKENKVMPKEGIYCVGVEYNGEVYYGMMYHGYRPTLTEGLRKALEVHIFDFDKTIYGEKIKVSFLTRLRDDKKFATKQELIEQIDLDKENSLKFLSIKLKQ